MNPLYKRVAQGIVSFDRALQRYDPETLIIPIGLDGAVVYHLLHTYQQRDNRVKRDYLAFLLHASSKTREVDALKLKEILKEAESERKTILALDLRTKTGKLGDLLADNIYQIARDDMPELLGGFSYGTIFDASHAADIRGSSADLTDEEKQQLHWCPTEKDVEQYIRKVGGRWHYATTHDKVAKFQHVAKIKKFLE